MTESDFHAWCLFHRVWIGPAARNIDFPDRWTVMRPDNNIMVCGCPDDTLDIRPVNDPPNFAKERTKS